MREIAIDPNGDDLARRIRALLRCRLSCGSVGKAAIASELELSSRTLDRELARRGTSFRCLLDDLRRELAEEYLREGGHTLCEIACHLGYSDAANFSRAFRRWNHQSIQAFRRAAGVK